MAVSRRQFIAGASAYGFLQTTLSTVRVKAEGATPRIRENIQQFSKDDAKVAALRLAVGSMKERSAKTKHDPLGWHYWSAVHGTKEDIPPDLDKIYNQCVHSDSEHVEDQFLSWHRAFLYYFEATLKRAAKQAGASVEIELPYWNWYSDPVFPEIFTENSEENPLWHPGRVTEDLTGSGLHRRMFTYNDMLSDTVSAFSVGLEYNPHGAVHDIVGGDMGDIDKAAKDPIFWLHHANIDRLWTAWMKGGSRTIPSLDSPWANTSWQFDEAGELRQTAGAMLDSTKPPLDYQYDDETMPMVEILVATGPQPTAKIIEGKPSSININELKNLQGFKVSATQSASISSTNAIKLGNETVTVDLKLPNQEATQIHNWAAGATSDIKSASLVLKDIEVAPGMGGFSFSILVSLPHEPKASPVVVGQLGSFSLSVARHKQGDKGGKQTLIFPLSEILPAWGNVSPEALESGLRVTFEPVHPPKAGLAAPDLIEIGAVTLDISTSRK